MKDAKSRFAVSTEPAGISPVARGGSSTTRVSLVASTGSGAPAHRRAGLRLGLIGLLVAALVGFGAPVAQGAYLHNAVVGEYGKEGPKATGLGSGCRLAWHASTQRIYLLSDSKIYGLQRTAPGTVAPLGGGFPISFAQNSGCGDPDLAVDNSAGPSSGNIYAVPSNPSQVYAFKPDGSPVGSPWPVSSGGGETCGVGVGGTGNVFAGVYSVNVFKQWNPAGSQISSTPIGESPCKIAVDPTNDDVFVAGYGSQKIHKFTAESGYATKITFPGSTGTSNPGFIVNGAQNRLYVSDGSTIRALDTDSGTVVETVSIAGGASEVTVDEATDTLFVASGGVIKEVAGAIVPDVTTGNSEGNEKVFGTVETAGGGNITECYFEFGTTTSYGSKEFCSPATPYAGPTQAVTANLPGLLGETTYHYRLAAHNANGKNVGGDKTITPHYVVGLLTDDAENVTRTTALLKGHFEGNGEATDFYFEWGPDVAGPPNYTTKSATPPGTPAGSPTGPTNLQHEATGLIADTVYDYRVVATNPKGVSPGNNKTLKTLPAVQSLTTGAATDVEATTATLNGSFNGDGTATSYHYEYGPTTSYGFESAPISAGSPTGTTQLPANISGLTLDTFYHYRVVATNSLGTTKGGDQTFNTKKAVENLVTKPATEISQESIKFNAEFEGKGLETHYYFEYGPTTAYGMVSEAAPGTNAGITNGPTGISSVITQFEGFTTYHYRVVAENVNGITKGNDVTFTTLDAPLPVISNVAATDVTPNSASFSADINPNRWSTVYLFEWGPTTDYGSSTLLETAIGGLDNENIPVGVGIAGLTPGTQYHFRVVAVNFAGVTNSEDRTFVTPGPPRVEGSSSSAITQTTARLSALAAGGGSPASVNFEYGPTQSYGSTTAVSPIGADLLSTVTEADISGLNPGTTYHFRAVATNAIGTTHGSDQIFTTQAKPEERKEEATTRKKCKKGFRFDKRKNKCVKKKKKSRKRNRG